MNESEFLACPSCSYDNSMAATHCGRCGKKLEAKPAAGGDDDAEEPWEDEANDVILADERESLGQFVGAGGAEMAANYLRANGIAAQVGVDMYPGVYIHELWVRREDAQAARELLAEAEAAAESDPAKD